MENSIPKNAFWFFLPIPFLFYFWTVSPTIGMGDSAILLRQITFLEQSSAVNNHSFTILIGHLFNRLPFGDLAFRGNLASAFVGASAIFLFFLLAIQITKNIWVAALAACITMVSHSMWWHSTIAENYAVNAFLSILILYSYYQYEEKKDIAWICRACLYSGLGLYNHVQMGFWLISTAAFILLHYRTIPKNGWKFAGYTFFGLVPYLILLGLDYTIVQDFGTLMRKASGERFYAVMFKLQILKDIIDFFRLVFIQFPGFYLIAIFTGIYLVLKHKLHGKANLAIFIGFCINTAFFIQYHTWDKFAFLLPSFLILGTWGLYGLKYFNERLRILKTGKVLFVIACIVSICVPVYLYANLPKWSGLKGSWLLPISDELCQNLFSTQEFISDPNKRNWQSIADLAELTFAKLPKDAVLITDDARMYCQLVDYYQKLYGRRPDLGIVQLNSWGLSSKKWGVGLDTSNVVRFIRNITKRNIPIFTVSLYFPHEFYVKRLGSGYSFERFYLDDSRWVYRIQKRVDFF